MSHSTSDPRARVGLREVAAKAGVSVSAVSLALRNRPGVSDAERKRIQRIATKLGYRPDPKLTELMAHLRQASPRSEFASLALVVPGFPKQDDHKLDLMIGGARARAVEYGFRLEDFWPKSPPAMSLARLREVLRARGIEGVLIGPMLRGDDELEMDLSDFSVAALGYSMAKPDVHRAVPHHYRMMREMLEELLARGFRRIGLVLWERMETGFNHLLSAAYFQAQHRLLQRDRLDVLYLTESPDSVPAEMLATWLARQSPEVLLAPGPVAGSLKKLGVEAPRDLGFVNLDLGDPPHDAAGLVAGYDLVGAAAVDLLVSQINLNQRGVPARPKISMVHSTWRPGNTLGQPRGSGKPRRLRPI